ncbi:MAG: ubiquinone/menaquinone biosynthesis methyltransferase [bacterium]
MSLERRNPQILRYEKMKDKKELQRLFSSISDKYDLLNQVFSFGAAQFWRKMAVSRMPERGPYLDLCAGTLELSLSLLKQRDINGSITAVDFCPEMLLRGRKKLSSKRNAISPLNRIKILTGDGECLPLKDNNYQGVMIGFGLRNLANRTAGLKEILRVLKPGGRLVVLEFSVPSSPLFRRVYYIYFCHILTFLGNLFSRKYMAYNHLRDSVLAFPDKDKLAAMMFDAGFVKIRCQLLTFGIVALHWGEKPV